MKRAKQSKLLAVLLTAAMMLGMLPTMVFAAGIDSQAAEPCIVTEGCTLTDGHEGECVTEPTDPTQGETAVEEKLAEMIAALPDPEEIDPEDETQVKAIHNQLEAIHAFAEENGIDVKANNTINAVIAAVRPASVAISAVPTEEAEDEHEDYRITEPTQDESTAEERLAEMVFALPAPEEIDPEDETQVKTIHNQFEAIYAFAEENGIDVKANDTINAVIAALYPADPLDDPAPAMSGTCGAEGNETNVTWRLEQNNDDTENPTYTLTISGEGAMRDFGNETKTPWYGRAIQTLVIGNGVTSVGSATARGQVALEKVVLADSVIKIGYSAFQKCTSLAEMNFPSGLQEIGTFAFSGAPLERADLSACTDLNSWERAFQLSNVKEVTLPDNLEAIPAHAFDGSKFLNNITLPEGLRSIGESAFLSTVLTEISIPDSVTSIGKLAFAYTKLQSVVIPSSVTAIADQTFMNTNMNAIVLPGNLKTIGNNSFNVSNATIYIVNIGDYADCPVKLIVDSTWSWRPIAVTNGGTFAANTEFENGNLATPTRKGYKFEGWYEDASFIGEAVTAPKAGKTYYAKWTEKEGAQLISYATATIEKHINDGTFTNELTQTTVNGTITYTSSAPTVATVDENGKVTIVGVGTAIITATAAETDTHKEAVAAYTLTVTDHSFTKYTSNNDATCTENGTKTAACDLGCGVKDTIEDAGSVKGHSFGEWEIVNSPNCTDKGSKKRTCSECGTIETKDVDPNGHDWEDDFTIDKAATCTTAGSKSIHCKNCEVTKDSTVISANGHTFQWVIDKDATATEKGSKHEECSVCHYKKAAVEIPATGKTGDNKPDDNKPGDSKPGDSKPSDNNGSNPGKPTKLDSNTPQTGDSSHAGLWFSLLTVSLLGLGAVLLAWKKKTYRGRWEK